jgi:hypothetical protein
VKLRYDRAMGRSAAVLALLPALVQAGPLRHFDVIAEFVAPVRGGGSGRVAVSFRALDPDVHVNESPAPRLKLDIAQVILLDRQLPPPNHVPDYDPLTAKYLDLSKPVLFPVALAPAAPRGEQLVKASVVFFYCSQREAWCRRGTADVEIPVSVR